MTRRHLLLALLGCLALLAAGCGATSKRHDKPTPLAAGPLTTTTATPPATAPGGAGLPGMPPQLDIHDVYAADRPGKLSPIVASYPERVYVPNSDSNTVDVIDPKTMKIIDHFDVGAQPQHVVPSWDLRRLWVTNDVGNSLTMIDPTTGKKGRTVPVDDPYNMYYTPDGRFAIVVAERMKRLDFRRPRDMHLEHSLQAPRCAGIDHIDYTADGRTLLATCEFAARLAVVDVARQRIRRYIDLPPQPDQQHSGMPQDVKLSPDGSTFYVADMAANGVYTVNAHSFKVTGFLHTGHGTHGLYVSRDSTTLYATNRLEGSISLISFATGRIEHTWHIPGGGSPDMGGVSADGHTLWLTGRYNHEVYAIDTSTGKLRARIPVGNGPHGLSIYPQPGRYSLGHTGIFR